MARPSPLSSAPPAPPASNARATSFPCSAKSPASNPPSLPPLGGPARPGRRHRRLRPPRRSRLRDRQPHSRRSALPRRHPADFATHAVTPPRPGTRARSQSAWSQSARQSARPVGPPSCPPSLRAQSARPVGPFSRRAAPPPLHATANGIAPAARDRTQPPAPAPSPRTKSRLGAQAPAARHANPQPRPPRAPPPTGSPPRSSDPASCPAGSRPCPAPDRRTNSR